MGTMKDCLLLLATLGTLAPPVFALTTDRILGFPARVVLIISLPAFVLLGGIFVYTFVHRHGLSRLILRGLLGGLLGTVALDAVRLAGVQFGAFPMDMPRMCGLIAVGTAPRFQTSTMATSARGPSRNCPGSVVAAIHARHFPRHERRFCPHAVLWPEAPLIAGKRVSRLGRKLTTSPFCLRRG